MNITPEEKLKRRNEILEKRCERYREIIKDAGLLESYNSIYKYFDNGLLTINDTRYLYGLVELEHSAEQCLADLMTRYLNSYKNADETVTKIENLTGYSLNDLLEKLAAGWELKPPENCNFSFNKAMSEMIEGK